MNSGGRGYGPFVWLLGGFGWTPPRLYVPWSTLPSAPTFPCGSTAGTVARSDPDADVVVRFRNRRALRRLVWAPNKLGFARAYVSGDVELEGDLLDALTRLDELADPERGPGVRVGPDTRAAVAKAVVRLGALGPPPRPPSEEIRLSGRRHDKRRDARAVSHHYDVGNEFYRLVLGPSMVYSCAYFEQAPSAGYTLEDAQRAKLDLVGAQTGPGSGHAPARRGVRLGAFVIHAAREYGVHAVGVTLSEEQATHARDRVAVAGPRLTGSRSGSRTTGTSPTGQHPRRLACRRAVPLRTRGAEGQ